jgi:hypothetical protein
VSDSIDRRAGSWQRAAPWVAPTLLALVALTQIVLVHTTELTAWKGGGFGMFSTSEGSSARHTHVFLSASDREIEFDLPDDLEDTEDRLLVLPSEAWLEKFASEVADAAAAETPARSAVRIEVWQTRLDPIDLTPRTERMRDYRTEVEPVDGR